MFELNYILSELVFIEIILQGNRCFDLGQIDLFICCSINKISLGKELYG